MKLLITVMQLIVRAAHQRTAHLKIVLQKIVHQRTVLLTAQENLQQQIADSFVMKGKNC